MPMGRRSPRRSPTRSPRRSPVKMSASNPHRVRMTHSPKHSPKHIVNMLNEHNMTKGGKKRCKTRRKKRC